jgi:hypothetical protein
MNCSERTTIIAEGIYLFARVMNESLDGPIMTEPTKAWHAWVEKHPSYADFVRREQARLFDRVNARF